MNATILLFHRVNTVRDKLWDPMAPELFEKIIRFVSKNYEVLPLQEICLNKKRHTKKALAITFDDGYRDYLDFALPVLKNYNLPSSMFVVAECVDNNLPTWTYIMDYLFFNTKKLALPPFDYGEACAAFAIYKWNNKEEQISYSKKFKQFLKLVDNERRNAIMQHFMESFDDVAAPCNLMMTWDDLRTLKNEPVEIGSHTLTHPPLATIDNQVELEKEIRISGEIIQQQLGYFPTTISYPVGSYNKKVKEVAKQAGYKIGLAVDQKLYNSQKQDLFEVPRIELYNDSFIRNKIKIYGIESALKSLIKK
ncbi:polysaccharide deacetylase family protein [Ferruginibacter sp.]|nr:polysaccharide deacetylase family protein [Ferruginibacter sp.]